MRELRDAQNSMAHKNMVSKNATIVPMAITRDTAIRRPAGKAGVSKSSG